MGSYPRKSLHPLDRYQRRCVVRVTTDEPYLALSFVGEKDTMSLRVGNKKNLAATGALNLGTIPKTFADAMRFTQAVGCRYLWIDKLCIREDATEEHQAQIAAMDRI